MWSTGSFSDNQFTQGDEFVDESKTAEVVAWPAGAIGDRGRWYRFDAGGEWCEGGTTLGWQTPAQVADWIERISGLSPA
jgi:hypothetical protein